MEVHVRPFVADAVIAHVEKGLAMAENGDTDAACALLGRMTSAEMQAEWDRTASFLEAHRARGPGLSIYHGTATAR